jgi:hypothetical protein
MTCSDGRGPELVLTLLIAATRWEQRWIAAQLGFAESHFLNG